MAVAANPLDEKIQACVDDKTGTARITTDLGCAEGEHQVAWNVRGPAGAPGPVGPQGPQGERGEKGEPGPGAGEVYIDRVDSPAQDRLTLRIAEVPAGSYAVDGEVWAGGYTAGRYAVDCQIRTPNERHANKASQFKMFKDGESGPLSVHDAFTLAKAGPIEMKCYQNLSGGATIGFGEEGRLRAIKVQNVIES